MHRPHVLARGPQRTVGVVSRLTAQHSRCTIYIISCCIQEPWESEMSLKLHEYSVYHRSMFIRSSAHKQDMLNKLHGLI